MELQIASALKQPGESFPFALEEPVGPQSFGGRMVAFEAPLSVAGRYVFDGKAVLVDGTVQTRLSRLPNWGRRMRAIRMRAAFFRSRRR